MVAHAPKPGKPTKKRKNKEKRKKQKHNRKECHTSVADGGLKNGSNQSDVIPVSAGPKKKPLGLLDKMRARLAGGQFRNINEILYTCNGNDAKNYFTEDPQAFSLYHAGYQEQMNRWPKSPVDVVIGWLKSQSAALIVADFGCGDARLAKSVKNKVFSLDLIASDSSVIACNMAHSPLDNSSVDVAVFSLSLMGTDYPQYLAEANRVLKPRGWLLIAEVRSRFDSENGGADCKSFIGGLKSLGFSLIKEDYSNKMFMMLYLRKQDQKRSLTYNWPILKPCLYKRR